MPIANQQTDLLEPASHTLLVPSCHNLRELGSYKTPHGTTRLHRFVRSGGTRAITAADLSLMRTWGITRALDLRSRGEAPQVTCTFAHQDWCTWKNVPLFDHDMSAPAMLPVHDTDNYLVSGYLRMLSNEAAIRTVFDFFAEADAGECVLFHCAAGMDRTGVVSMLLLSLAEVPREQVIADYAYSLCLAAEVDEAVARMGDDGHAFTDNRLLASRITAIAAVYDTVVATHGSVPAYLKSCGVSGSVLATVRAHLCE